jgi:TatA/E family protein of Tat protein translocase
MFGTLGFSEIIIILAIVLIIFGAGRLPQIGEGLGKALKGFKKEVHEAPPPLDPNAPNAQTGQAPGVPPQQIEEAQVVQAQGAQVAQTPAPATPYQPGPELTPGTTAALMASAAPQMYQPPRPKGAPPAQPAAQPVAKGAAPVGQAPPPTMTMEERQAKVPQPRAAYPPLPSSAQSKAPPKRPSAIVNKDAVARVQAQQAALKAKAAHGQGPSSQDMQSLGEGLGDALRTFRQAVSDVRGAIDPEMRTIQAEMDAAQKELEQSIEAAKEMPAVQEDPPKQT